MERKGRREGPRRREGGEGLLGIKGAKARAKGRGHEHNLGYDAAEKGSNTLAQGGKDTPSTVKKDNRLRAAERANSLTKGERNGGGKEILNGKGVRLRGGSNQPLLRKGCLGSSKQVKGNKVRGGPQLPEKREKHS